VASAVEGLEPEAVSVLDMRGHLLNRPRKHAPGDSLEPSDATLEYRRSIERNLLAKINSTLEPVLGEDGFRAGVSVECDFTSGEQSEETFDPTSSVMTTSQRTEDLSGGAVSGGVPGTASNLPRPTSRPGLGSTGRTRRTENVTYQTSRVVRRTRLPQGQVKRISVALLVDYGTRWEGEGEQAKKILEPPTPEKLKSIRDLVAGAIGLQTDRGDQLIVETLPFTSTLEQGPPSSAAPESPTSGIPIPAWLKPYIKDEKTLVIAGAAVAAVLLLLGGFVLFLFVRKRRARSRGASVSADRALKPALDSVAALEPSDEVAAKMQERLAGQVALKARLEDEALQSLKLPAVKTKKTEVLAKHISEEAERDPVAMANLVRTWLNEEED